MRRHAPFRVLGLVLAFWFALTGGERAIVELCPMHGNLALYAGAADGGHGSAHASPQASHGAAHGAGAHADAHQAPAPEHDHATCGCGGCCMAGLTPAVVPAAPTVAVATERPTPTAAWRRASTGPRAPAAYALPFPTGPPRA